MLLPNLKVETQSINVFHQSAGKTIFPLEHHHKNTRKKKSYNTVATGNLEII